MRGLRSGALALGMVVLLGLGFWLGAALGASSNPARWHANAKAKQAMAREYAGKHHLKKAPKLGRTVAVRKGNVFYALADVAGAKAQPEMFLGKRRSGRAAIVWKDRGASHGKPCRFGSSAVVTMLGYADVCGLGGGGGGTTTAGTTTTPTPNPGSPYDIAVTAIAGAVPQGSSCEVTYTIQNVGSANLPGTSSKLTVASASATKSVTHAEIPLQTITQTPGQGQAVSETVPVPIDCSSGTFTVTVDANSDDLVQESNYANNVKQVTVTPSQTKLPDLTVTSAALSADCTTASAVIENVGNADAGASEEDILAGNTATRQFLGSGALQAGTIAPGGTVTVTMTLTTPTCHSVQIDANADDGGAVAESNEDNNSLSVTIP